MPNSLNLAYLRNVHRWFAQQQPVHLQRWIAVPNTGGFDSPVSYRFDTSYVAGIADDNQQTFRDSTDFRSAGTVASKAFVVIIPYEAGKQVPEKDDLCILYRLDGTIYARGMTTFVHQYDAGVVGSNASTVYKTEVHISLLFS